MFAQLLPDEQREHAAAAALDDPAGAGGQQRQQRFRHPELLRRRGSVCRAVALQRTPGPPQNETLFGQEVVEFVLLSSAPRSLQPRGRLFKSSKATHCRAGNLVLTESLDGERRHRTCQAPSRATSADMARYCSSGCGSSCSTSCRPPSSQKLHPNMHRKTYPLTRHASIETMHRGAL